MPVLGGTVEQALERGDVTLADDGGPTGHEWVLRHYGDEFPVAPGTETLPLRELVDAQAYRLSSWREAGEALNYRRFFDVTSLVAVRVEDPVVFMATHALLLALHGHGEVDGFRIDHPDGLADPGGYLERLADATGDAWVVVEKILEGEERLPDVWRCAGTTGLRRAAAGAAGAHVRPPGLDALDRLWADAAPDRVSLDDVVAEAKRLVVDDVQAAEVDRLMRLVRRVLGDVDLGAVRRALEALLVAMDRYRAYVVPGRGVDPEQAAVVDGAAERARGLLAPERPRGPRGGRGARARRATCRRRSSTPARLADDFRVRFQQTCGPVMAKGIEDTAYYRWFRLAGANEVGGHPDHLSISADEFHAWCEALVTTWPTSMTTLTTHDTKRSEDVRARLMVLAEDGEGWATLARGRPASSPAAHRTERVDGPTEYLVWQTLVGTWPITGARLEEYLLKAVREAKVHTAWVDGDPDYEDEVVAYAKAAVPRPRRAAPPRRVDRRPRAVGARERAVAEADPADHARRARRLPGLRDRHALARRPRQPPPGRLDRPRRAARAGAGRRAGLRPRRREAAGHRPRAAACAATCPGCSSGRARRMPGCPPRASTRWPSRAATPTAPRVVTVATRAAGLLAAGRGLRRRDRHAARRHVARRALRRRDGVRRRGGAPRRPAGPPPGGPAREAVVTAPDLVGLGTRSRSRSRSSGVPSPSRPTRVARAGTTRRPGATR